MIRSVVLALLMSVPATQVVAQPPVVPALGLFDWPDRPAQAARTAGRAATVEGTRPKRNLTPDRATATSDPQKPEIEFGITGEIWTGFAIAF